MGLDQESRVKVYVHEEEMNQVINGKIPGKFWLSRPDGWDNLVEVSIPVSTYQSWTEGSASSPRILHD